MSEAQDLIGADLDMAVAMTGEWKTAHELFPTMTLDPTFSGARVLDLHDRRACFLIPRNPMRQDPQEYSPTTDWAIGGRLIERERIQLGYMGDGHGWQAAVNPLAQADYNLKWVDGPTPLIAAMRALVAANGATHD